MITKGDLLVTSQNDKTVKEYNGTTGAFVDVAASGGALGDPLGVVMGLDGNLLVSDGQTNQVKRYSSATGSFMNVFASTNLAGPGGMTIHNGVLYVANSNSPQGVQSFDATSGDFVILMQDLAPAASPDQVAGVSLAELTTAIDGIATLHARWWDHPRLAELRPIMPSLAEPPSPQRTTISSCCRAVSAPIRLYP